MRIIEKIVFSNSAPDTTNTLWIDGKDIKIFGNNGWSTLDITENQRLYSLIQEETTDRKEADKQLLDKINEELSNREEEDEALREALATETQERQNADNTLDSKITQEIADRKAADTAIQTDLDTFKNTKGEASGLAPLNESGKVDSQYLPSFVDDVVDVYATYDKDEVGNLTNIQLYSDPEHQNPITGEAGKIYQNIAEDEPAYQFRWTGTIFTTTGSTGLIIGEVTGTAYDGGKGKHTTDVVNSIPSGIISDLSRTPGSDSMDINMVKYIRGGDGTFTQDIPRTVNIPAATKSTAGVMSSADKQKLDGLKGGTELETELQGITEDITNLSDKVGSNTYTDANYISKETNLTDAAMQLDEEIKATNDNIDILNAATVKSIKVGSNTSNEAFSNGVITIANATTSTDGALSKEDKVKLDNIEDTYLPLAGGIITGTLSVAGNTTLGNVTITGNVTQQGDSFITEAETVQVKDNLLVLNNGEAGAGVTAGISGIEVDRGTETNYQFIFDESDDYFKVGEVGNLQTVLTRDTDANLTNNKFFYWDNTTKQAKTRDVAISDISGLQTDGDGSLYLANDGTYKDVSALSAQEIYTIVPSKTANAANASVYTLLKNNSNIVVVYKDNGLFFPISWKNTVESSTFMGSAVIYDFPPSEEDLGSWTSYDIDLNSEGVCYCVQRSLNDSFAPLKIISFIYPSDNVTATGWNASLYSVVNLAVGYAVVTETEGYDDNYNKHIGKITKTPDNITIVCTEGNTQITYVITSDGNITKQEANITIDWSDIQSKPSFATVATSGSYNDLTDKPSIPSAYTLPIASADTLGGIRVGAGLSINGSGVLSATGGGTADSVDIENVVGLNSSWLTLLQSAPSRYVTADPTWTQVTGKPDTFTPSAHTHTIAQITDLQDKLDEYVPINGDSFKPNNICWGGTRTDGTTTCLAFISPEDIALFGHTSLPLKLRSSSNPTVAVGSNTYTLLHKGNFGSITFTGAATGKFTGQNDLTINIPSQPSLSGYATQAWANSQFYPLNGKGYLSFDTSGRPVMANNQGYSFKRADGSLLEGLFVSINNELVIGGTSSDYVTDIKLNCTNLINNKSGATYLNTDNVGSITFTGAVSATFDGTNDITVNIPEGGGVADSVDWSNVTNKPTWIGSSKPSYSWNEISSKPSTFTPSAHTHDFDEINFGNTGSNTQYLAGNGYFYTIRYSELSDTPDLSQYATKSYVQEVVGQGGSVDLSNYVTLDGTQTITGTKTFTQYTVFSAGAGTSSDKRLKRSIKPIENPFEILEGLTGYRYTLISNNAKSVGLIAQDVEKVLPEAVRTDDEGYKSVDTYPIVAVLVETIKELKKEIEELKSKL